MRELNVNIFNLISLLINVFIYVKIDRNVFSDEDLRLIENGGISLSESEIDIDVILL